MSESKLYHELADWFHLLTAPADYAEEAAVFLETLRSCVDGPLERVLELGCGGGNNASHLKAHLAMTLVDRSAAMLEVSRALNPECEHLLGDMREVRLERAFDAVFVHDAVAYLTTVADLEAACRTCFAHTRPGGVTLLVPDYTRESFRPRTSCGGHDGEGRALRYLEWTHTRGAQSGTYRVDFAYLLCEGDAAPRVIHDRHVLGLFPRSVWLETLRRAGFAARAVPFPHGTVPPDEGAELFVGVRG